MSKRSLGLKSIGVAAVIMAVVVLLKLAPVPRAEDAVRAGPAPKTPWGEPDLQGIWTNNYEIPSQRPARYANKEFFTDEERAELDQQRTSIIDRQANETRRTRGTEQDVSGAYNQAIFVTHKHVGRRTSLIVDPPDGRIPPLTPEAQKRRDAIRTFQLALLQATDTCASGGEIPAVIGRGIHWLSTSPISLRKRTSRDPAKTCIWLNAGHGSMRTRSNTPPRSRMRQRGTDRGP